MATQTKSWLKEGKREYEKGEYSEAINYFNHQIRYNIRDTEAWYYKGKAWLKRGKLKEAQSCFEKVIEIEGEHERAWRRLGETYVKLEQIDKALETFDKAIEDIGDSPYLWLGKSKVYLKKNDMVKARRALDRTLELDSSLGEAWLEKGKLLDESGIFENAIECYTKATRLDRDLSDAWFRKGNALMQLGRYKEAIRCYDWTTRIDKDNIEAWYRKGDGLFIMGKTKRALQAFEKVLELEPEHREAIYKVGQIYEEMGNVKLALQYYSLTDKEEGWGETLTTKGDAFFRMDKLTEALKAYNAAIEANINNYRAWAGKAKIMLINKNYHEAVECLNQSIKFELRNPETRHLKANALFYLHKYGEAFESFDKALSLASEEESISILLDKSMALIALNRTDDAVKALNMALNKDRDNEKAERILSMLKDSRSRGVSSEVRHLRELYQNSHQALVMYRNDIILGESMKMEMSSFKDALYHAVNEMKDQNFLVVLGIIRSNIKKLDDAFRNRISDYLDHTREMIRGLDPSVDTSRVEGVLAAAERGMKNGDYKKAFDSIESTLDEIRTLKKRSERIISLRRQDPRYLEEAKEMLGEVNGMLEKAYEHDLDAEHIKELVEKADVMRFRKNYMEAANILKDAKKYARNLLDTLSIESSLGDLEKDAKKAIKRVETTLKDLRAFDLEFPGSEDMLEEAKDKLGKRSFPEAYIAARKSLTNIPNAERLERFVDLYKEGQKLIKMTRKFKSFPTDKLAGQLRESKKLIEKKKINDAVNILEKNVPPVAQSLKNKALLVKLKVTQQKISKLQKLGKDTSEIKDLVVKSKPAMQKKEYDDAIRYVEGALKMANNMLTVS